MATKRAIKPSAKSSATKAKAHKLVPIETSRRPRVVALITRTNNVPPIVDPLGETHDLLKIVYDRMTEAEHETELLSRVVAFNPDWVLYVGAIPGQHRAPIPKTHQLAQIGAKYPLVHLCFDAAEPLWWPHLNEYYDHGRFALQVGIDGTRIGPIGDRGLVLLCPVDVSAYMAPPWSERFIPAGFAGTLHPDRRALVKALVDKELLTFRPRGTDDFTLYTKFLAASRLLLNSAATGASLGLHVKARPLEAAAAGCLVLETRGSPLGHWFNAGTEFLEYAGEGEAAECIQWVRVNEQAAEVMAQTMRKKVLAEHNPKVFWSRVLERLGRGKALVPTPELPRFETSAVAPVTGAVPTPELPRFETSAVAPVTGAVPTLLGSKQRYNFVMYQGRVWIVPQGLGPLDLADPRQRAHKAIRSAQSLSEAETLV